MPYHFSIVSTLVLFFGILFFVLFVTARISRRHAQMLDRKTCPFCHTVFNADARFCGRCGRTL